MIQIAPSILNSDLLRLGEEVAKIKQADWLHFDVMDGHFVPNLSFGPMFVAALKTITTLPIESHLMVKDPEKFIALYANAGSKRIIIHPEGTIHLHRLIQTIKEFGCEAGVALNPATSLNAIEYLLDELDLVLLMTVNPGFGGQKLIPSILPKIRQLRKIISEQKVSCRIEVDGGVNWDNVKTLVDAGADTIVAGTLIYKDPNPEAAVLRLKELVTEGGNSTVI